MSQTDDSAPVDGKPAEPEASKPEAKASSTRRPAKKAASRSGTTRSTRARSGESPPGRAASKSTGRTTAKSAGAAKATASTRKRAASTRQRAAGLTTDSATATAEVETTPVPEKDAASVEAEAAGIEIVDEDARSNGNGDAPVVVDDELRTDAPVNGESLTGKSVTGESSVEGPTVDAVVTDQSVTDRSGPAEPPPIDPPVDELPPVDPPAEEPESGAGVVGAVPAAPEHDAWLARDFGESDLIGAMPIAPRPPPPAPTPRWTGRWTADPEDGMVTGVPGLDPEELAAGVPGDEAEEVAEVDQPDPAYLATLPPPPVLPSPPTIGERLEPVRSAVSDRSVRLSAWATGLIAGRRRTTDAPVADDDVTVVAAAGDAALADAVTAEPVVDEPVDDEPVDDAVAVASAPDTAPGEIDAEQPGPGSLDPAYLATLPPPPAPTPAPVDTPTGDLVEVDAWTMPDWSVSGTDDDNGTGPVVDLAVTGVNSDQAVITEPPPAGPTGPDVDDPTQPIDPIEIDAEPLVPLETTGPDTDTAAEPEPELVAPGFVRSRHQRRKEWRRVEKARRYAARRSVRFPIFTRSILLWMLLFALTGMAAGGTAAVFWTHFNTQIAQLRDETQDFDKRSEAAEARIEGLRNEAVNEIDRRMKDLAPALAEPRTVQAGKLLSPYVWFVSTLDETGVASVGTAFSVASDERSTWLLTSFNVVRAGTVRPAPPIKLRKDPEEVDAELVSWDAANDLALIRMDRGSQPMLEWAAEDVQAKLVGNRLYVVTGFGGTGATLNSAMTIDQNSRGLLHDGRIGTAAQGGPMVTTDGKVVGVASLVYQPLGFDPGELHYAASIRRACDVLLTCTMEAHRVRPPGGG